MRQTSRFRIKFLGSPSVIVNGRPLTTGSNKALALLGYLAVRGTALLRSEVDGLLWPEADRVRARRSLREELSRLRKVLPVGVLQTKGQQLSLNPETPIDLWGFERAYKEKAWEQAAVLYGGFFLEGMFVKNAEVFESWLETERDRLQEAYIQALHELSRKAAQRGDIGAALAYTRQIITANPLSEAPYVQAMRWAQQLGETAVALDIYHSLQLLLRREFGMPPSPEASAFAKEVATQAHLGTSPAVATVSRREHHNLPAFLAPFVGREPELARIGETLVNPFCRFLTLVGLGGVGKTRLAVQTANQHLEHFPDGVWYLSFNDPVRRDDLATSLAEVLSVEPRSESEQQRKQVASWLKNRSVLVVLDNVTFSKACEQWLLELLAVAPRLKLLVTARRAVQVAGEWIVPIKGMRVPASSRDRDLGEFDALELFMACVHRLHSSTTADTDDTRECVIKICRLLSGFPLGIELAAARLRSHSYQEVARELAAIGLDQNPLERAADLQYLVLWNVLEESWAQLEPEEQQVYNALSVFTEPFDRSAVLEVTQTERECLSVFIRHSLLERVSNDKYIMPLLLRKFATSKLAATPERRLKALKAYSVYRSKSALKLNL